MAGLVFERRAHLILDHRKGQGSARSADNGAVTDGKN